MATDLTITHHLERRLTDRGLISRSSAVMGRSAVFAGTRVPASTLIDYLLERASVDAFMDDFLTVDRRIAHAVLEQVRAALAASVRVLFDKCMPRPRRKMYQTRAGWSSRRSAAR